MKILLVDDHPLLLESVAAVLQKVEPDAILLKASTLAAAIEQLQIEPNIDLLLLDLQLPDASGLDGLTTVKSAHPSVAVVVLSATEHPQTILAALKLGASGFIPKSSPHETLVGALELVIRHKAVYIPLQVLGIQVTGPLISSGDPDTMEADADDLLERMGITGRAKEVFAGLVDAKPLKVIARELKIAESTVKSHARSIYLAMRAKNRAELLVKVAEFGIAFRRKRKDGPK